MDWDSITFSLPRGTSSWPFETTVNLANPLKFTKADCACVFEARQIWRKRWNCWARRELLPHFDSCKRHHEPS